MPFEFSFQTNAGDLTLSAASYSISPQRGAVHIFRPELKDSFGRVVATLDSLEATNLDLFRGTNQIIKLHAIGFTGQLVRLKNGRFDFQAFLPQRKSGKATIPFDITIDRSSVQFTDETGLSPWTCTINAPRIKVTGLGQDWIADTTAQISQVGEITTRIQNVSNEGISITGSTKSAELASVAKHFAASVKGPQLQSLRMANFKSLIAKGPFQVFVPLLKPAQFAASIEARSTQMTYQGFSADAASFTGQITNEGIGGVLKLTENGASAIFQGSAAWSGTVRADGQLDVAAPSESGLPTWAQTFIPKKTVFDHGTFHGWLTVRSSSDYHLSGNVEANSVGYNGQHIERARLGLEVQPNKFVLDVRNALYGNQPLNGIITIDPKSKSILGSASASAVDLARAGTLLGVNEVAGQASLSVLIDGTLSEPGLDFVTHGQGIATVLKKHTFSLGQFEVAGRYDRGSLTLSRGVFNTPEGLVVARGALGTGGNLGLQLTGRGVLVAAYDPRLGGEANLSARVTGTVRQPVVTGRIEGYDITYKAKAIPAIVADFRADHQSADITNLQAARGTASLGGFGHVQFRGGAITGELSIRDIQLADWLDDEFVGAVDIPHATIGGTLSKPTLVSDVEGTSLVVRGIKVDKLSGTVLANSSAIAIHNLKLTSADGSITGEGSYDIERKLGTVSAAANGLNLDKLMPVLGTPMTVHGNVSAKADVKIKDAHFVSGQITGRLNAISINGSKIGNGTWNVHSDGSQLLGDLDIEDTNRYVRLTHVSYDPDRKKASGDLSVLHVPAEQVIASAIEYFPNLSVGAKESLQDLAGSMSLNCKFSGTSDEPSLNLQQFELLGITFRKQPVGDLHATLSLDDHKWNIQSFLLGNGPATLSMTGLIDERGDTHIDATQPNRFDLDKLSLFDTRLSRLTGTAKLWFTVDGPTKSPRIVASLNLDNILAPPGMAAPEANDDRYLRLEFDKIVLNPSNTLGPAAEASGNFFYKGFRGTISGTAPFEYPLKVPTDKPVEATITLSKSDLTNIGQLVGGLDATRTSGSVDGSVVIGGKADALAVSGSVNLVAEALSFAGVDDVLKNAKASLSLSANDLQFQASGQPIRGGSFQAKADVPFSGLTQIEEQIQKLGTNSLLDSTLVGEFQTDSAQFRQRLIGQSTVAGTVHSDIKIKGSLRRPTIVGSIGISSADVVLKGFAPATTNPEERAIDPTFNISLNLDDPARLRSSTADMMMLGTGNLQGSLQYPIVETDLSVEKGTVRLPAALLRIDQGGSVKVTYGTLGSSKAAAIVDLEGNTSVTASRYGDSDVQRYDISLGIKGDLLQDNGLVLSPSSDPPDLTPDRILAILGQADLLQSFSNGTKESTAIQTAMLSSVPMFLDPYTDQVAKGLGLDFLNLEYNSFDLASVAFGKILGSGFSVEGSRQLSEPPPGFPSRYDLRLLYRPRRFPGALKRVRFFVGSDQDRPWKVGLEYGVRF